MNQSSGMIHLPIPPYPRTAIVVVVNIHSVPYFAKAAICRTMYILWAKPELFLAEEFIAFTIALCQTCIVIRFFGLS